MPTSSPPFPRAHPPPLHPVAALHCRRHPVFYLGAGATTTSLIEASTFLLQHLLVGGFWVEPLAGVRGVMLRASSAMTWRPMPPRPRLGPGA